MKPLSITELLETIEQLDEDDSALNNIYVTPPNDDGEESAKDSGEEDCRDPDRLSSWQLQSEEEFGFIDLCYDPESSEIQ